MMKALPGPWWGGVGWRWYCPVWASQGPAAYGHKPGCLAYSSSHTRLKSPHQMGAIRAWSLEAHATVSQIPEPRPQDSLVMDGF